MNVSRRVVSFIVAFVIFAGSLCVPASSVNASTVSADETESEMQAIEKEIEESTVATFSTTNQTDGFKFSFASDIVDRATEEKFWSFTSTYYSGDDFEVFPDDSSYVNYNSNVQVTYYDFIEKSDGTLMAKKGDTFKFGFYRFMAELYLHPPEEGQWVPMQKMDKVEVALLYTDDTYDYINITDNFEYVSKSENHNITYSATAKKDIRKIRIISRYIPTNQIGITGGYNTKVHYYHPNASFEFEIEPKEVGLLSGILDSVSDGFGKIGTWFAELPGKLWSVISDGLKSLFVPDEEFFQAYFDDLYDFFHQKLGFLLYPFELLGKLLNVYLNLDEGSGEIVIPDIKMFDVALLPATKFNLKEAFGAVLRDYYDLYYAFVDVVFLIAFVNLAKSKFDKIVH